MTENISGHVSDEGMTSRNRSGVDILAEDIILRPSINFPRLNLCDDSNAQVHVHAFSCVDLWYAEVTPKSIK